MDKPVDPKPAPATADHLQYVRLRAPKGNAQTLDYPPGDEISSLLARNVQSRTSQSVDSGFPIDHWRSIARAEITAAALAYSKSYLPSSAHSVVQKIESVDHAAFERPVVFAGHQPALFHPGVWYKNFRLHHIAMATHATAINLVVDNDLAGASTVKSPQINPAGQGGSPPTVRTQFLKFDEPGPAVAYEMRTIENEVLFRNFDQRVAKQIAPVVSNPIIEPLWREVKVAQEILGPRCIGHLIAAGRHRLEWANGLRNLELPVSHLSATRAFCELAALIIENIAPFQSIYNDVLKQYRLLHGIRSSAHPVPELSTTGQWHEAPFWIWTSTSHRRLPLMVRLTGDQVEFSGGGDILAQASRSEVADWLYEQSNDVLAGRGRFYVRPRALITTMYSRLLGSELFVHGIGGAKYDQVTDQIISDFFQVRAPDYLTATGTWKLPPSGVPEVHPRDITRYREQLRRMRFHPEKFIENPSDWVRETIATKMAAIADEATLPSKQRHRVIESANTALQELLVEDRKSINLKLATADSQLRDSQIMHSREYSFCLHDESLIKRLHDAARI